MSFNKKFFTTGGIVASAPPAAAAFDPLQNFETVTYTGNGSTQKITGYIRKGAAFNGSSSYIAASTNTVFDWGTKSVSLWINISSLGTGSKGILNKSDNISPYGWFLYKDSADNKISFVQYDSSNNGNVLKWGTVPSLNTWYHICVTGDGTTNKMYVNGSLVDSAAAVTATTNSDPFTIGRFYSNYNNYYINGKIDQVRFFNRALDETTDGEVTTLYGETYASSTKSTTDIFNDGSGVALYELDEDALTPFKQAAVFNGSSYINNTSITAFPSGTSERTLSFWVNAQGSGVRVIGGYGSAATAGFFGLSITASNIINFLGQSYNVSTTYTIPQNQWVHIVTTYDGTTQLLYANGVQVYSISRTYNTVSSELRIGDDLWGTTERFNGSIDQVRIYSSALSSTDVEKLYNESSDVPTSTLIAHYKLDGNATDETGSYDGTETSITYSAGVYGGTPTNVNFLGMAFQPDFVWIKRRSSAQENGLYDSVRGATKQLYSDLTNAEVTATGSVTSFDSNGFSIGNGGIVNGSGQTHVAWCWKAGGSVTPNNNTDGDITSTVSANQDAGFSIVKWTDINSNGTSYTIGHGLSVAPELIITKEINDTGNWIVYAQGVTNTNQYLMLNSTAQVGSLTNVFGTAAPTSTVFGQQSGTSVSLGKEVIAYCFHSVDGYQKVGSYTGQSGNVTPSSTNSIGFRPRFLIIKRYDGGGNWYMFDSTRGVTKFLVADSSAAEGTTSQVTFSDNGFSISGSLATANESSIYLAIA